MEQEYIYLLANLFMAIANVVLVIMVLKLLKQIRELSKQEDVGGDFRDIIRLRNYIAYLEKRNQEIEQALGKFHRSIFRTD